MGDRPARCVAYPSTSAAERPPVSVKMSSAVCTAPIVRRARLAAYWIIVRVRPFSIRRASSGDSAAIVDVLRSVVAERVHSAIDEPWTVDQQCRYLESLSGREVCLVADSGSDGIVGYQSLDRY